MAATSIESGTSTLRHHECVGRAAAAVAAKPAGLEIALESQDTGDAAGDPANMVAGSLESSRALNRKQRTNSPSARSPPESTPGCPTWTRPSFLDVPSALRRVLWHHRFFAKLWFSARVQEIWDAVCSTLPAAAQMAGPCND